MAKKCKKGFKNRAGVCVRKDPLKNFIKDLNNGKTIIQKLILLFAVILTGIFTWFIFKDILKFVIYQSLKRDTNLKYLLIFPQDG